MASTSDCGRLITGGIGGEVRVWKMYSQTQALEGSLSEHRGRVYAIAVTNDDKKVSAHLTFYVMVVSSTLSAQLSGSWYL